MIEKENMREFTINLYGKTQGDIELASEEVHRLISQGYRSGTNSNDEGGFFFESTGDEEDEEEDEEDEEEDDED